MGKDTFESVVAAYRKMQCSTGSGCIAVGRVAHAAVRKRLSIFKGLGPRRRARAETVADMADAIVAAGFRTAAAELNRMICCYHVGEIYGPAEAKGLPWRTLRAFCSTIRRVPKDETWVIKPKLENIAPDMFARAVAGEIQAGLVQAELNELLGRKPRAAKPKPSPVRRILQAVSKLGDDQQRELYRALQRKFSPVAPLPGDEPSGNVSIPIATAPGKAADVRRPLLKKKLGLRAG